MRRAYLSLAMVTVLWGTIPLIVREVPLSGMAIVAVRLLVAAIGLGAVIAIERGKGDRPRLFGYRPWVCVAMSAILGAHWVTLFEAYKRTEISTVILIVYLAPVGVAAVAPRILGERVTARTWAALAVAVTGFLFVAGPAVEGASVSGLVLAAISATLFVSLIVVSKPLAQHYGGLRTAFIEFSGAALMLSPALFFASWGQVSGSDCGLLLVLGLIHTGAAVAIYLFALAQVPATNAGIMGYLEPVSAVLLSWAVLNEPLPWTSVFGGLLIVAAGVYLVMRPTAAVAPSALAVAPGP